MQFPIKSHRELNVSRTQFLLNLTNNFYIGIIISIVFIIRHNNDVLYKPRELCPKDALKLSLVHGRQAGAVQNPARALLGVSWEKPSEEVLQGNVEVLESQVQC